ncbi:putative citrate lyase beta chain [Gordonia paraffinivorans NBRC 108238]|uniref:Citrate lyase beta chain n=1 Tax=Gordonia paraffinivorans NBRC 108238 TaxID=1223543 RepID=A0ABQ0IM44_9ACTN|nr:CoA ester lyase [Gordonia paraffinivorans]GAC84634.1 putative citrate lyase beta chain [Gordonia paraffinivorans NBRC 108238]
MKPLRSFLFVPGDSEKKLGKIDGSPADAIILDLEDSVSPSRKADARRLVADYLREATGKRELPELWVRINPLDSGQALADLAAVIAVGPAGIMIPKIDGPAHVQQVSHYVDALEASHRLSAGRIRLLPVATETAVAPFRLGDFAAAQIERLYGLTWGAEDLSAALGASTNVGPDGGWAVTYQLVRSMTLMGARAAGVEAVETLYVDIRDPEGLAESSRRARAEGFSGRIAIHPAQVEVINEAFTPTEAEVDFARRVVAAFEGEVGTVALDGKMLDLPHLKQAQRVLALVG